ncbi:hypothetical protein SLE2022_114610 [Rubroshorea leprosula]
MGTGWRRAFCTTISRDPEDNSVLEKQQRHSPRICARLGLFSSGSNPSTPTLRCWTGNSEPPSVDESPRFQCRNANTPKGVRTPKTSVGSNPSSPRSPLKLSLFRNSFKFRSSCGICLNSVKTGQGTAIYTAECSHAFHFPCIVAHVRKHGNLICPVCNTTWTDAPLLAAHKNLSPENDPAASVDVGGSTVINIKPNIEDKKIIQCSPRAIKPEESKPKPLESRSYDDDEPLFSPTTGGRFIPIPEADENVEQEEEDDEAEEFQGFFVNPSSSSSIKSDQIGFNEPELGGVQVRLLPETAVISVGRGYETYAVALRVKAPPPPLKKPASKCSNTVSLLDPTHRAPIDLVTVLDVSRSMTGEKLHMLKRAMRLVISSLGSADRLSIVAFSAVPKRLLPLRRMTALGQRAARHIVERLVCSQGTSVGDALRKATKVLEDRRERNPVASIILLSDGGHNERVQNNATYQRHRSGHRSSTRFAHIEIPVHSFGFGQSSGYSREPAEYAFAKCVGGLLSVVVQDLRIQLDFQCGSNPAEITAVYSCNGRPTLLSSGSVRLGDLYAEEERELLVELRVPTLPVGIHHVMSVRCLYKDPATQEVAYGRDQGVLIPPPHSGRSTAPKIERLRYLFISTRAIAESRRLIEHNDLTSAHHLLASARDLLVQSNSILGEEYVRALEAELAELQWRKQQVAPAIQRRRTNEREAVPAVIDENGEPLTPTSAWKAAETLAKVAIMKKSMNRVSDLHGFEYARF